MSPFKTKLTQQQLKTKITQCRSRQEEIRPHGKFLKQKQKNLVAEGSDTYV